MCESLHGDTGGFLQMGMLAYLHNAHYEETGKGTGCALPCDTGHVMCKPKVPVRSLAVGLAKDPCRGELPHTHKHTHTHTYTHTHTHKHTHTHTQTHTHTHTH
eukprot:jgi/Botrbrau1/3901/Bobra.0183s0122.1